VADEVLLEPGVHEQRARALYQLLEHELGSVALRLREYDAAVEHADAVGALPAVACVRCEGVAHSGARPQLQCTRPL
jgi:hypothetical protein